MAAKKLWWYEARRCGWVPLALPVVVAALLGVLVFQSSFWAQWLLDAGFALAVGLCVAAVAAGERMTELQLTVPTALPHTMGRRFVLLLAPALTGAVLVVVSVAGELHRPAVLFLQMVAFVALLAATAAGAAVVLRSLAGASTLVIVVWLVKLLMVEQLLTEPVPQAVMLLLVAAPVFALAMRRLADGQHLIGKELE
jgi:hypothetical protein